MPLIPTLDKKDPELAKDTTKKPTVSNPRKDTIKPLDSQRQKRTQPEIRNLILDSVARYPKSTHAVSKDCKMRYETALFNLEFLQDKKKVEVGYTIKRKYKTKDGRVIKQKIRYWRIKE